MLVFNPKNVESLIKAGLTNMQSKVYLALIDLGKANVASISKVTSIDRSNVYRLIKDLEKLELIERNVGISTTYSPIPLEIGMSVLINRKKMEYKETVVALEKLARNANKIYHKKTDTKKEDVFKIYPSGSQVFCRKWETTLRNVKKSVDVIATERREPKDDPIWDIYVNLLEKGVKVRWIIDRSFGNDEEFLMRVKQFQHLFQYPDIEMKICHDCLQPYGAVCDNKLTIIFLCDDPPIKCAKSLWTNNKQILKNFNEHFETSWNKGIHYSVLAD